MKYSRRSVVWSRRGSCPTKPCEFCSLRMGVKVYDKIITRVLS